MKAKSHGVFLVLILLIFILLILLVGGDGAWKLTLSFAGMLVGAVIYYFFSNRTNADPHIDSKSGSHNSLSTNAHYSLEGLFRKGRLTLTESKLVFESNGLEDFGPYYYFPLEEIVCFRMESIRFSGDVFLILQMRCGRDEQFRVAARANWECVLSDAGVATS